MLPKSSSQKTLRAAMQEERTTTMASRLLSTDASLSNPSFRVYYGVASAGSVPFLWESTPGTPKNAISDTALPPLTPPPSYYNKATKLSKSKSSKKLLSSSKPASFVHSILPKLRRSHTMPSPSASKESVQCSQRNRLVESPRSSFSSKSRGRTKTGMVGWRHRCRRCASGRVTPAGSPGGCMGCLPPWLEGKVLLPLN